MLLHVVQWVGSQIILLLQIAIERELSGRVLDSRPRGRTRVTALCPGARHINPSLVLVQPRKTHPFIAERLLMGHKE